MLDGLLDVNLSVISNGNFTIEVITIFFLVGWFSAREVFPITWLIILFYFQVPFSG